MIESFGCIFHLLCTTNAEQAKRALIIDWKTNRITRGEVSALRERYRPLLAAYWKAVSEMLNAPVSTALYATASGAWLPYTEQRLAETWRKICHQPEVLGAAIMRDR
jgi:hypothetical protein